LRDAIQVEQATAGKLELPDWQIIEGNWTPPQPQPVE
jgi:hypothetical protein